MNDDGSREQWHIPFYASYEMEFMDYRDVLEINPHYLLASKSEMDILTVKKKDDVAIDNGIGSDYRKYNLIEYKSPDQSPGIDVFYQMFGYAFLYIRLEKVLSMKDVLSSLICYHFPQKLVEELKSMDYTMVNREEGIFYFEHSALFPVQVVLLNKVDHVKYPWMSLVQKKLSVDRVDGIADLIRNVTDPVYLGKASEVTDLVVERFILNDQKEGAKKMGATRDLFKAEFEERDRKIEEQAKEIESNKKELECNKKLLESMDKQLESKDSIIEKLKTELARLGGNVAMF